MKVAPVLAFFLAGSVVALGQTEHKTPGASNDKNFPNTLQPVNPTKYYGPRKAKKKSKKQVTYDARKEYDERVERAWREQERKEKVIRLEEVTDYGKPPYFGHKKPPKIRPIGKRKHCKICGIRH